MNDMNFIGVANHSGAKPKRNWFHLKSAFNKGGLPDGSNVYRIMPPLFSLAPTGKWNHYVASHEVVNSQGWKRTFECIQDKDNKTKEIKVHCPYCDHAARMQAQYDLMKQQNVDPEQLKAFKMGNIDPFKSDKNVYMNVIDLNNNLGVLTIGYKLRETVQAIAKSFSMQSVDVVGMKGVYLNFKKIQKYNGDRDTVYQVEPYRKNFDGGVEFHAITPELLNRIKDECYDLPNLFKKLSYEQIAQLLNSDFETRKGVVDTLWSNGERASVAHSDPMMTRIAGTDMSAIGNIQLTQSGMKVNMPDVNAVQAGYQQPTYQQPAPAPQAPAPQQWPSGYEGRPAPAPQYAAPQPTYQQPPQYAPQAPVNVEVAPNANPFVAQQQAAYAQPAPQYAAPQPTYQPQAPQAPVNNGSISDEAFSNMFGAIQK